MPLITVDHIDKSFTTTHAVRDVSFTVEEGEIFGLLGPNGAGKTTTIRIILDIFKPDSGSVSVLGGAMNEEKKRRIGYLPEERGLYQDIRLEHCLNYLAGLKGLAEGEAKKRVEEYLVRFDLIAHRRKKVKELSRGMQQKAQLISTLVHRPEILIIDEPFSGLDPVNTQMIKDLLREERQRGVGVVMCSHQMNQVEELCDRIVLINQGQVMLYGGLHEVRRRYAGRELQVRAPGGLPAAMPGVEIVQPRNGAMRLHLREGVTSQQVLRYLVEQNVLLEEFEIALPTLDEIFIQVVKGNPS